MITERITNLNNQHQIYTHSLKPGDITRPSSFMEILGNTAQGYVKDKRTCEYFDMADETGTISYKSATFVCDKKNNTLMLGDCSNESNCLRIKLSKGGSLLVNRENIDQLLMSISMFSAKDQGLIMQAVMKDKIAQAAKEKKKEGEETKELEALLNEN